MDLLNKGFLDLITAFETQDVKYLLVGGWAVNHYGFSRTTGDIDFWLKDDAENRSNLIKAFRELGYGSFLELERVPFLPGFCEIYLDFGMYADLLSEIHGFKQSEFDKAFENANLHQISEVTVRFISYQVLITSKSKSTRPKDIIDVEELKRINLL